jgi:excinuclease ABC subunit C
MTDETDTDLPPSEGSLSDGMRIIAEFVRTLPRKPGVYRMLDEQGEVVYVGKARNLKARVTNYTRPDGLDLRIQRMIAATRTRWSSCAPRPRPRRCCSRPTSSSA